MSISVNQVGNWVKSWHYPFSQKRNNWVGSWGSRGVFLVKIERLYQ